VGTRPADSQPTVAGHLASFVWDYYDPDPQAAENPRRSDLYRIQLAGVILFTMLNGDKAPFVFANSSHASYDAIIAKKGIRKSLPLWVSQNAVSLFGQMPDPDQEERVSLQDELKHSWLIHS